MIILRIASRGRLTAAAVLAAGVLLLLIPSLVGGYTLVLATRVLIFAIFAMSLDLLVGYTGMPSLGHAAFFGVGAYAAGMIAARVADDLVLSLVAGLVASLAVGAVFGLLALRSRGVYFLMLTLALAQVLWGVAYRWRSFTGGDTGFAGIPRPILGTLHLARANDYYLFTAAVFCVAVALLLLVVRSPFGLSLQGIRESPLRMAALGYHVWLHRYLAYLIAAFFAGLAGVLLVFQDGIASPSLLTVVTSAEALLMVILGGAGTMLGPILGAVIIVLLEFLVSQRTERWLAVLGAIYILVVVFTPNGVYPPLRAAALRLTRARAARSGG